MTRKNTRKTVNKVFEPAALREIYVTRHDLVRLESLIAAARRDSDADAPYLDRLESSLAQTMSVDSRAVPPDVVTMNSRVELEEPETGAIRFFTLVFPQDADPAAGRISVLAPLGTALLGAVIGDRTEWQAGSALRSMRLRAIPYQPEAAGDLSL
jgi:regulator of nucleoside diphosphate kinase